MGADADHLKTTADIDLCMAAGYTFFTIDPGAHVDPAADTDDEAAIRAEYAELPWRDLGTTAHDLGVAYVGKRIAVEDRTFALDEPTLLRAAVKYGRAVAHVAALYRHLASIAPADAFELEVSVDETDTPTSHAEHLFIVRPSCAGWACAGSAWLRATSAASRKGWMTSRRRPPARRGDHGRLRRGLCGPRGHRPVLGPYKLSLHSGSDKFSIYGIGRPELARIGASEDGRHQLSRSVTCHSFV